MLKAWNLVFVWCKFALSIKRWVHLQKVSGLLPAFFSMKTADTTSTYLTKWLISWDEVQLNPMKTSIMNTEPY